MLAAGPFPEIQENTSIYSSSLLSGGVNYRQLSNASGEIRSFSIPVILPMELSLGRLYLGGSVDYAMKEYRSTAGQVQRVEGPGYLGVGGRFVALDTGRVRLEITESVNAPVSKNDTANLPAQAWLNTGYRLDSGVNFSYLINRAQIQVGAGYRLNLARNDYNMGDELTAALRFGYGFGSYSEYQQNKWPMNVFLGITSHYNYADLYKKDQVIGTEYGTVFFAPGLQLSNRSVIFQASVEMPIRHLTPTENSYQDRIRGNIGMKYYLR